ncbi:MAG: FAD-binding oxidoreductase [Betaproteobacteria bacterium]|nr:MAG: FAD-binding oxidoreductase [Betaproteobacteria bacterium]
MRTVDVCIVGGGLLGTATAMFAARRGLRVLLLEAGDLASGASGAAFGGVSVGIYSFSSARVPDTYVALSKASLALYTELQDELGPPMDFTRPGSLDPFYSEKDLQSRKDRVEGLRACGVDCRLLDRKQVQDIEPAVSDLVVGATYCPVDGHITPPAVTWAWAAAAKRAGAEICTRTPVLSILRKGNRVVGVRTANEEISADWVVNVAGVGAEALLGTTGIDMPISYSRGQMFVTDRVPRFLNTYIHNIKQTVSGTVVLGATRESGVRDTGISIAGIREILGWARRLLPALERARIVRCWAGVRMVPPDGYPIIGKVEGLDNLVQAVMHRGVTLGPIVGKLLVELMIEGKTSIDISPYNVSRFGHTGVAELGAAQETFYAGS